MPLTTLHYLHFSVLIFVFYVLHISRNLNKIKRKRIKMIKWGGRKSSSGSSSSSASSFNISHASPFTWLSKFRKMRISSEASAGKMKHKAKQSASPQFSCEYGDGFCVRDNSVFCEQQYSEESYEDKKNKNTDGDDKRYEKKEGTVKLKEKDIGEGEKRKLLSDGKVSKEMDEYNREKEYENLRRRFERKAKQAFQEQILTLEKQVEKVEFGASKAVENNVLQIESPRTICTPRTHAFSSSAASKNSFLRNIVEEIEKNDHRLSHKQMSFEKQNLKQTEELKVNTNRLRQPQHQSRELQRRKPKPSSRVKIHSPRMVSKVEICKIKALEDKKKANQKMKKERKETVEETAGLESFAVIKCSLDPRQDFRDSMIEMIMENQIYQPEEMEKLLACYLTLNADEYHDLIIKVFRQVWFDMSTGGMSIKPDMMKCYCYD